MSYANLKRKLKRCIPFTYYRPLTGVGSRIKHFGLQRYCPVCRTHLSRFVSYGASRPECECPVCGALERHRLLWLFLKNKTNLFDQKIKNVLHFAPEWSFVEVMSRVRSIKYTSADIASPLAMVRLDITALPFTDSYFDAICCSHVLEHIPNDSLALREIFRVMKPGGWFLADVPILREKTYEDFSITDPEARAKAFGQSDHVRIYGADFKARLESAGFLVNLDGIAHELGSSRRTYYGVNDTDIYLCVRPTLS